MSPFGHFNSFCLLYVSGIHIYSLRRKDHKDGEKKNVELTLGSHKIGSLHSKSNVISMFVAACLSNRKLIWATSNKCSVSVFMQSFVYNELRVDDDAFKLDWKIMQIGRYFKTNLLSRFVSKAKKWEDYVAEVVVYIH